MKPSSSPGLGITIFGLHWVMLLRESAACFVFKARQFFSDAYGRPRHPALGGMGRKKTTTETPNTQDLRLFMSPQLLATQIDFARLALKMNTQDIILCYFPVKLLF